MRVLEGKTEGVITELQRATGMVNNESVKIRP
jgi:hypothetical protein